MAFTSIFIHHVPPLQEKLREIDSFKETPAQQGKKNILETYKDKNK